MKQTSTLLQLFAVAAVFSIVRSLSDAEISQFTSAGPITANGQTLTGTITLTKQSSTIAIASNGIPDHAVGVFGNVQGSINPNAITEQSISVDIPLNPAAVDSPTCLNMGAIGVATNGASIFNPFAAQGDDAVLTEDFDSCDGHPSPNGQYHYHKIPGCLYDDTNDKLLGVLFDGFPIYGQRQADGTIVDQANLDKCNGHYVDGEYRYRATTSYPYLIGCFTGGYTQPGSMNNEGNGTEPAGMGPPPGGPPGGGDQCSFAYNAKASSATNFCHFGWMNFVLLSFFVKICCH